VPSRDIAARALVLVEVDLACSQAAVEDLAWRRACPID
jgi:hypothetical protein